MEHVLERFVKRYRELSDSVSAPGAKPLWKQLREIMKLRSGVNKLSAAHYFWMNLGSEQIYKDVDLGSFGGTYQTIALHRKLNSPCWDAVVTDKLVMWAVFSMCKVPQPEMYAAACRFPRQVGNVPVFQDKASLVTLIKQSIGYPFFCKPIKGGSAKGCRRVESYDASSGRLALADGGEISPEDFIDSLRDPEGWGYLFQEAVRPHPDTRAICGDSVSGCRVIMLLGDDGPRIFRVVWKLPAKGNYVDNFVHGTTGNSLADVDTETGRVKRVVSGTYTKLRINPLFVERGLPNTERPGKGRDLVGERLPDWQKLKSTMESVALAFPGFRFQHWDVGLTSKGPLIYELNTAGDLYLPELAKGSGVYDEELKRFLRQYGNQATRRHFAGGPPIIDDKETKSKADDYRRRPSFWHQPLNS